VNYQSKYENLIRIINSRLDNNMTPLAAKHCLSGILQETGETNGRTANSHIEGRQEDRLQDVERRKVGS
jgi:hypothetical protein